MRTKELQILKVPRKKLFFSFYVRILSNECFNPTQLYIATGPLVTETVEDSYTALLVSTYSYKENFMPNAVFIVLVSQWVATVRRTKAEGGKSSAHMPSISIRLAWGSVS